jgi:hypothetical protein
MCHKVVLPRALYDSSMGVHAIAAATVQDSHSAERNNFKHATSAKTSTNSGPVSQRSGTTDTCLHCLAKSLQGQAKISTSQQATISTEEQHATACIHYSCYLCKAQYPAATLTTATLGPHHTLPSAHTA